MSSPSICRNCLRIARQKTLHAQYAHIQRQTYFSKSTTSPAPSATSPSGEPKIDPTALLSKPTWSIRSLLSSSSPSDPQHEKDQPQISHGQISHLLRLSALPTPSSPAELQKIISTLQSQLLFVKEIQKVDTTGVAPLSAIRDESAPGVRESTITLETLSQALSEEESFGHCKRPRRKRTSVSSVSEGAVASEKEDWDVLATASEKAGRYFVVRSKKTKEN
ncbi:hypothetical protein QBC37DRAFT_430246 [Rhypophila decipiens]|uniref:Glutamyl-tRNA amidotransferase complex subunit Gta3 domain-containing protein n=1 Tax=Rhypophila decipiens TaxID=261697 RepID=A0AAN6Y198_9PEZI|nr:hypothetical protein QBC37DRAFT_430246 [Rhypophila decipiens]